MPRYLGNQRQQLYGGAQIAYCQRCGWKFMRTEIKEDEYLKGLLVCPMCWDPDHPQRYPAEPRPENYPPLRPAPDQFAGPNAPILSGTQAAGPVVNLAWEWPTAIDADNPDPEPTFDGTGDGPNIILYTLIYRSVNGGDFESLATVDYAQTFTFPLGVLAIDTTGITYTDSAVAPGQTVAYYVVPYDAENNVGGTSNTVTVTIDG
jgi:hypothetical protein